MNLYTIEQIPYPEKKILVTEACLMYTKVKNAVKYIDGQETNISELNDFVQASNVNSLKTASFFEVAMNLLTEEEKTVIENDFISVDDAHWWTQHWAKTTYYKIKHQAVNRFLYFFYV